MKYLVCMRDDCNYIVHADNANQAIRKVANRCGYDSEVLTQTETILEFAEYFELVNNYMALVFDPIESVSEIEFTTIYGDVNLSNNSLFVIE